MSNGEYRLTTVDNPFNPFTEFDKWFLFDSEKGYGTCGLLARVSKLSPDMTDEEETAENNRAIDEIVMNDFQNLYRKVKKNDPIYEK